MSQLGFTFYPKDWWTSDSFYALNPFERYIYLELLFMMYINDGFVANDRINTERRLQTAIKEGVWSKITDLLVKDGDQLTHKSVNARLRKTLANRENGLKGGRPDLEMELTALDGKVIPRKPNAGDHFIYLFRNLSNNTYKIGETKDLFKRRLTIKIPTADLKIIHFEFIDRSKNLEIERHLKLRFIDKQISGDWFSLTNGDVIELITEMESLKKPNNPLNNQLNNPPSEKNRIEIEKNIIEIEEPPQTEIKMDDYKKYPVDDLYKSYIEGPGYQAAREAICISRKITPDQLTKFCQQFTMHLKSTAKLETHMREFLTHFNNWLHKQDLKPKTTAKNEWQETIERQRAKLANG